MSVVVKFPGTPAAALSAPELLSLESLQTLVGGYIEVVPLAPGVDLVCNEEATYAGPGGGPLEQNAAGILGPLVILGSTDDGDFRQLTPAEVEQALAYLERFKDECHPLLSGGPMFEVWYGTQADLDARHVAGAERLRRRWEGGSQ